MFNIKHKSWPALNFNIAWMLQGNTGCNKNVSPDWRRRFVCLSSIEDSPSSINNSSLLPPCMFHLVNGIFPKYPKKVFCWKNIHMSITRGGWRSGSGQQLYISWYIRCVWRKENNHRTARQDSQIEDWSLTLQHFFFFFFLLFSLL